MNHLKHGGMAMDLITFFLSFFLLSKKKKQRNKKKKNKKQKQKKKSITKSEIIQSIHQSSFESIFFQ